jgi:hypothetical protein
VPEVERPHAVESDSLDVDCWQVPLALQAKLVTERVRVPEVAQVSA